MYYGNQNKVLIRKTIRFMVGLTILAWATQTLFCQWGFSQLDASAGEDPVNQQQSQKFITPVNNASVQVELRREVRVVGQEVKFSQLFRFSTEDAKVLGNIADLVMARFGESNKSVTLTLIEVRQTLSDAKVNLAAIRFSGASECSVTRTDATNDDDKSALEKWINQRRRQSKTKVDAEPEHPTTRPVVPEVGLALNGRNLRSILINDLAERLHLGIEQLQVSFDDRDEKLLSLVEPMFHFRVASRRGKDVGLVTWDVTIWTDSGQQKVNISAQAQAWQNQVIAARPISFKQVIREQDISARRELVDHIGDDMMLTQQQIIGQQASRDIRVGMPITARMIEATPLVRSGELVTVILTQGTVQVRTVARAQENGSYGQSIKVRNESTRDVFDVVVIGNKQATLSSPELAKAP